jgi:GH18 family chitinase
MNLFKVFALLFLAPLVESTKNNNVLFAFTGGDYANHETWRWDEITHLGFWTEPSDEVRAMAKQYGVELLEDAHLPDKKTWTDENSRKQFAQEKADLVKSKNLDGVFFDYEGNDLNKDEKNAYAMLAKEVKDATNGTVVICVGGRPSYEWRDYPYADLAESSDFLFVMGYDLIAWDDYTCITKGTCSPADAPIKDLELGLTEYLKDVPSSKLVLGLPWYGNRYTDIIVPFNDGQIDYKDVLEV